MSLQKVIVFAQKRRHLVLAFAIFKENCQIWKDITVPLADLSKGLNCLNYEDLITKFQCSWFPLSRNNLVNDLHNRNLGTKISDSHGTVKNKFDIKK